MKRYSLGFLILFLAIGGWYVYKEVLPYRFGLQDHISLIDESGKYNIADEVGEFHGKEVVSVPITGVSDESMVLGSQDEGVEKRIEVDLTHQKLYAVENGVKVAEFDVSSGKFGRTPTGSFRIWYKTRSTKMSGGSRALGTYYYLPNVPYTMFFANAEVPRSEGYGIHGAYWHSSFGIPMSHGCINMRIRDVEKLYYWANPDDGGKRSVSANASNAGTEVVIYGKSTDVTE